MIWHFAYINDSTGELDWLAPYLREVAARHESTSVCTALPRLSKSAKQEVFQDYFNGSEVKHFALSDWSNSILRLEFFLERVIAKLIRTHKCKMRVNKVISYMLSYLIFQETPDIKLLYLDYNLKEKALFKMIKRNNSSAKVIVFPHSTALMTSTRNTPKPPPECIECALFLECTQYNSRFYMYHDKISVVGSPTLDQFRSQECTVQKNNSVLFLTRRNDAEFAMDEVGTLKRFKKLFEWCEAHNLEIHVKHHPRDTQLEKWRNLYGDSQVIEVKNNITKLDANYKAVFATYTSAVVLFAAKGIPTFDFTYYKGDTSDLAYHYLDESNMITHELVELGIVKRMDDEDFLNLEKLSLEMLSSVGSLQKEIVDQLFPKHSVDLIIKEVNKLDC